MSKKLDQCTVNVAWDDSLQSLDAPNAKYVDAIGCTGLQSLDAPNAETVDARGCTALKSLNAPNATTVYARGCTGLVEKWRADRLIPLLTATGKSVADVLATGCWECHEWANCPMHVVFGASSVEEVPQPWRQDAAIFVPLFDAGEIPMPEAV